MPEITLKIDIPENLEAILKAILGGQAAPAIQAPIEDEIWGIDDLCTAFKMKKSKAYSLTMQTGPGSMPRFKLGRDLRFRKSEVTAWFDQQRVAE